MKKISFILTMLFTLSLIFTACNKDTAAPEDNNIIPENFTVEIPSALMSDGTKSIKSSQGFALSGNDIYKHLTTFIFVGNEAAEILSNIIGNIRLLGLSEPMSFTFESQEDGKAKNVVIIADSEFEGTIWQYQLTITDADSEGNEDGGLGLQIFWNRNPIKGIAIIKPSNLNRNTINHFATSMFRIAYSETGENSYEKEMTVSIAGLTLADSLNYPYSMETLKMSVGKNGNNIDVFGNSNHPNARFFSTETGFNYAFVASGSNVSQIAVAEVALPASDLNSADRTIILKDNSVKNVFTNQIYTMWPNISTDLVNTYLQNTEAPGYFNNTGFVVAGVAPGSEYEVFKTAIESLVPYNPIEVTNLTVNFK